MGYECRASLPRASSMRMYFSSEIGVRLEFPREADGVGLGWVNERMARVRIVPFRCEEWGGEFAKTAGGLLRTKKIGCKNLQYFRYYAVLSNSSYAAVQ